MKDLGANRRVRANRRAPILVLTAILAAVSIAGAGEPRAVATFESIGIDWSPEGRSADRTATVRYRTPGSSTWKTGPSLWFDGRESPSPPFAPGGEYRGSIVGLAPGTTYEIELRIQDGPRAVLSATTWTETFPVAETVTLPEVSSETLVIDRSGSPAGYIVYTAADGRSATIDVGNAEDHDIVIRASYVVVRGLTLKGARSHAIEVSRTGTHTDVIIEENDISGWGRTGAHGFGVGYDSAIRAENPAVSRLVIQRNRIHHPRGDANSWCETREGETDPACATHPEGPHGIRLTDTAGNHVIRYNTLETDDDHFFADGIGGGTFSYDGFPGRDSDVYGNLIERCWDNAIESEGGNRNVRIWANYIDRAYSPVAMVPVSVGPLYLWRNVVGTSRKGPPEATGSSDSDPRGRFVKSGSGAEWGGGRVYIYHNTLLQAPPSGQQQLPLGVAEGVITTASGGGAYGMVARNNILQVVSSAEHSIQDDSSGNGERYNDFDYDLYNGKITSPRPQEAHGTRDTPLYDPANGYREHFLHPQSPGYDRGVLLHGFNEGFRGAGPDVGAFERDSPPLEYGVNAYRPPAGATPDPPEHLRAE